MSHTCSDGTLSASSREDAGGITPDRREGSGWSGQGSRTSSADSATVTFFRAAHRCFLPGYFSPSARTHTPRFLQPRRLDLHDRNHGRAESPKTSQCPIAHPGTFHRRQLFGLYGEDRPGSISSSRCDALKKNLMEINPDNHCGPGNFSPTRLDRMIDASSVAGGWKSD